MKEEDFINWPDNLQIKLPAKYNSQEMKTLLSHLERIRFSDKYLEEQRMIEKYVTKISSISQNSAVPASVYKVINKVRRKRFVHYFRNQLPQNKSSHKKILWNSLTRGDFINWPVDISVKSPSQYFAHELNDLISNLEKIKFSEQFLQRIKSGQN
jgi:hypothetical protein